MNYYERACAEINLDNFAHNVMQVRNNIDAETKIMAVVKADAYGHGALQIAETALECGVNMFGVAIMEEAIALRRRGINVPIIIMGASFRPRIADLIDYDCQQTVFSIDMAREIQAIAKAMRKTARIQIKIDTGMGRLGFLPSEQTLKEIEDIFKMENIKVEAICSHLSCADSCDKTYTIMQNERFLDAIEKLKERHIQIPALHISNSAGIVDSREMNYDTVRAGIVLYGLYPSLEVNTRKLDIKPCMSLKTNVTFVKTLGKGEAVSYSARYITRDITKVATIPVGYADGYMRRNDRGRVIINGKFAPIIGNICMDQFMVDVSDIDDVAIGDEAVLIGKQGDLEIDVYEIANNCDTITHDVICAISKRIPRIYIKKGRFYNADEV